MSYTIEILADATGEADVARRFAAYLLFVQWKRIGEQGVSGHLESGFLEWDATATRAKHALGAMPLVDAQRVLDSLIGARDGVGARRRWHDVVPDVPAPDGER
jgi:hypothetical protein